MKTRILLLLLGGLALVTCKPLVAPPYLTEITPSQAAPNEEITLHGEILDNVSKVVFGKNGTFFDATPKAQTEFSLRVVVPALPKGFTEVRVSNDEGESNALPFTVLAPKLVLGGFSPASARRGEILTLTGENLDGVTEVRFGNGVSAPATFKLEGKILKITVPNDARSGPICLKNSVGTFCTTDEFNVLLAPTLTSISPTQGVTGVEITLTRQNLSNARVYFDAREVAVKSNDGLVLKVNCPTFGVVILASVKVVTPSGEASIKFTGAPQAEITATYPAGLVPGSALTLRGKDFLDVASVQFKNTSVPASEFILDTPNSVTVRVPAGTQSGDVRVIHQFGAGKSTPLNLLRGTTGLTTDNIAASLTTLTFGSLDSCATSLMAFCNQGKLLVFLRNSLPCNETHSTSEKIAGDIYEVFADTRFKLNVGATLKAEKVGSSYSGFIMLLYNSELHTGNVLKDGSIALVSVNSGTTTKLCRALPAGGGTNLQVLPLPVAKSLRCGACEF
ncbi:MAG: IPT/TIG domain-containing protein [Cytophagaceae bacterium]|nr:IPT/TIG domain-containing protein [Cytophagaceae bacterium]